MNSINTQADTLAVPGVIDMNREAGLPADFLQNMVPRIDQESLMPMGNGSEDSHWCPPGHGDVYLALQTTGLLDRLLEKGYRTLFLSNGDNLGATADARLLDYFTREKLEFMSEVTPKTLADLKGGVLFRRTGGGAIELLETAQVPDEHIKDFQDVERFAYFNINNLWANLEALRDRLKAGSLDLSLIVNPKVVEDQPVLQLETAMGAAVGRFERTRVMIVPRRRFAPAKTCADLLVRRSDACELTDDLALELSPKRTLGEPVVKLSDHYKKIRGFEELIPELPSLLDCKELSVEGPVRFDQPVSIKGAVRIRTNSTDPVNISKLGQTELVDGEFTL